MIYKDELDRIYKDLEEKKRDLEMELATLPDGELLCTSENGQRRYYQRLPATGNRKKEHRYGIKTKPELLGGLIRKDYAKTALRVIDRDLRVIGAAKNKYAPIDELSIMSGFVEKHPDLSGMIFRSPINEEDWVNQFDRIENYHPENLKQTAADGTMMRSKSELYIASRLDHYGITYRSDCPTGIPGLRWVPDFSILRKRDHKIIYWEHFGMMDIENYRFRNRQKLIDYEEAGIVPWDNLIITYDMAGGRLKADLIEAVIKSWLL